MDLASNYHRFILSLKCNTIIDGFKNSGVTRSPLQADKILRGFNYPPDVYLKLEDLLNNEIKSLAINNESKFPTIFKTNGVVSDTIISNHMDELYTMLDIRRINRDGRCLSSQRALIVTHNIAYGECIMNYYHRANGSAPKAEYIFDTSDEVVTNLADFMKCNILQGDNRLNYGELMVVNNSVVEDNDGNEDHDEEEYHEEDEYDFGSPDVDNFDGPSIWEEEVEEEVEEQKEEEVELIEANSEVSSWSGMETSSKKPRTSDE